jgi:hypothetical protein
MREPDAEDLAREAEEFLRGQALVDRFVELLREELMRPAKELFGQERAVPWLAHTLRTTAELLERIRPPSPAY